MNVPVITQTTVDPSKLAERYGNHSSRVCIFILSVTPSVTEKYRVWFFKNDEDRIRFCEDFERFIVTSWPK